MSLESDIVDLFQKHEVRWKTKEGLRLPDEDDVLAALDEAARILYTEPVGAELQVGQLIIVKNHRDHDVYVRVGTFI